MLRKYGEAATIDGISLITAGTTAFNTAGTTDFKANPTLAAGDVTISKDGGNFASIEGAGTFSSFVAVAPAGSTSVQIKPDATAMTCKRLVIRFIDQTGTKEWQDQEVIVETYGHANAMHVMDFDAAVPTPSEIATEVGVTSVLDENTADHDTPGTIGYSIGLLATGTGSYTGDPVVDGSANPIEGAIVSVHTDAACATDPVQVLVTDALGLYTVRRPAGTYYLFISAENYQSIVGKEITVA